MAERRAHGLPVKTGEPSLLNVRLYWPAENALNGAWGLGLGACRQASALTAHRP